MPRGRQRREPEELGEPEILPMMNVLFMLVMVLMGMSAFLPLGVISTEAPKLGGAPGPGAAAAAKQEFNLTIMLLQTGINLSAGGAMLKGENGPLLPKIQQGEKQVYDFEGLRQKLWEIKEKNPNETRVMIMADPDVIYNDIIHTMDASRQFKGKLMFPEVAFVPGVIE